MIDDDAYVELAKCCTRACHVLKAANEGRSADSLSGPSKKRIEDLGRCVDPANSSPPTITSGISIVRHLEVIVRACANCARNLREHHPGPTKESLIALREILGFSDVRGFQPITPTVIELPQGYLELDNALAASENEQCAQGPTKAKSSMSTPNGYNLPPPVGPSLVLVLCLIGGGIPEDERTSLIEVIFSSGKTIDTVRHLRRSDAQTFIDIVDEVRYRSSISGRWVD
jgi:hypothetical protein